VVTVEFRGIGFVMPPAEAALWSEDLGLAKLESEGRFTISDSQAEAAWRRALARERRAGWSAGSHRLANALREAFDPEFDAGPRAFHRRAD
jgi:hypothetical protein